MPDIRNFLTGKNRTKKKKKQELSDDVPSSQLNDQSSQQSSQLSTSTTKSEVPPGEDQADEVIDQIYPPGEEPPIAGCSSSSFSSTHYDNDIWPPGEDPPTTADPSQQPSEVWSLHSENDSCMGQAMDQTTEEMEVAASDLDKTRTQIREFLNRHNPAACSSTDADETLDIEGIPSVEHLRSTYDEWKRIPKTNEEMSKLSRSKRLEWKMTYTFKHGRNWERQFPWIEFISVNGCVVGALCKTCRGMSSAEFNDYRMTSMRKSGGKWVTVPFTFWGRLLVSAKKHEFGSTYEKTTLEEIGPLRKSVEDGTAWIPESNHMKVHMNKITKQRAQEVGGTVSDALHKVEPVQLSRLEQNEKAFEKTICILHRIIKRADSPFSSLKDAILFQREAMGNQFFSVVLRHIEEGKEKGISARRIGEFVESLFKGVGGGPDRKIFFR